VPDNQAEESSPTDPRTLLLEVAIESWRLAKLFGKVIAKLDAGEAPRYANQIRYHLKMLAENLEAAGLRLVTIEGHTYDPGIAASALNIDDFAADDLLIVDQMIEPIVMGVDGLVRPGTVVLKKVEK
jgi:hypothetical protein